MSPAESCEPKVAATVRVRRVTYLDTGSEDPASSVDVALLHELKLEGGRSVVLLRDRGFGLSAPWASVAVDELETDARATVGPDEPFDELTAEDMERDYWRYLAALAAEQGILVTAVELSEAPHDVEFAPRLLRLLDTGTV